MVLSLVDPTIDIIEVEVENDGTYVFVGDRAEQRHQEWALTGAAVFDFCLY